NTGNMLVSAKAVNDSYPLRGEIIITDAPFTRGRPVLNGPPPGEVWLESRVLPALDLEIGDMVYVGETELRVGRIIITEPDRQQGGMVDNAGPRLMMHYADVDATGVVQVGSRVSYRNLFASDSIAALDGFESWVGDNYERQYRLRDIREESEEVRDALEKAESFLLLGSLFAVLLAGVAIALTAKRYSERHFDYVAILKTLGCTSAQISFIYLSIQVALAFIAIVVGSIAGWLVHQAILSALQAVLLVDLPEPGLQPFVVGALTAIICLLAFALPPLLALRETPPLRVLRKDLGQQKIGANVPYVFGIFGTIFLVYWYSQDLVLTSVLVTSVAGIGLFLSLASLLLLQTSGSVGMKAGSAWKLAMTAARRRRTQSVLQVMVFSVTIMSLLILTLLRTDLISDWQAQLPENTPNHFMMNITPSQVAGMEQFFADNGVESNAFYPLISARVTRINNEIPDPRDEEEQEQGRSLTESAQQDEEEDQNNSRYDQIRNTLESQQAQQGTSIESPEQSQQASGEQQPVRGRLGRRQVTFTNSLPPDNRILAGEWWGAESEPGYVSIEQEYASWLELELGDVLEFEINRQ
ncbi:MAG: FtsX-like permease family protein, partial [Gammaproteobacteria bacterium]